MQKKNRNTRTNREQKEEKEMRTEAKRFQFTVQERLNGLNKLQALDKGIFLADYIVPEEHKLYGILIPLRQVDTFKLTGDKPVKAVAMFSPDEEDEEKIQNMMNSEYTLASHFLSGSWHDWTVEVIEDEA